MRRLSALKDGVTDNWRHATDRALYPFPSFTSSCNNYADTLDYTTLVAVTRAHPATVLNVLCSPTSRRPSNCLQDVTSCAKRQEALELYDLGRADTDTESSGGRRAPWQTCTAEGGCVAVARCARRGVVAPRCSMITHRHLPIRNRINATGTVLQACRVRCSSSRRTSDSDYQEAAEAARRPGHLSTLR